VTLYEQFTHHIYYSGVVKSNLFIYIFVLKGEQIVNTVTQTDTACDVSSITYELYSIK